MDDAKQGGKWAEEKARTKLERMLRSVGRANERLRALGMTEHAIVYTGGAARLLDAQGRERLVETGPPALACGFLAIRVELGLRLLLTGERG